MKAGLEVRIEKTFEKTHRRIGYNVVVPGRQTTGDAHLLFMAVQDLEAIGQNKSYNLFRKLGLKPADTFAGLAQFYPNGHGPVRQYMRRGVGTIVFAEIIKDCRAHHAKALYLCTSAPTMMAFARKKGFKRVEAGIGLVGKEYCLLLSNYRV